MQLGKPDPRHLSSRRAQRNFSLALKMALVVLLVLWSILIIDYVFGLGLAGYGLRPRQLQGLIGVFSDVPENASIDSCRILGIVKSSQVVKLAIDS